VVQAAKGRRLRPQSFGGTAIPKAESGKELPKDAAGSESPLEFLGRVGNYI